MKRIATIAVTMVLGLAGLIYAGSTIAAQDQNKKACCTDCCCCSKADGAKSDGTMCKHKS